MFVEDFLHLPATYDCVKAQVDGGAIPWLSAVQEAYRHGERMLGRPEDGATALPPNAAPVGLELGRVRDRAGSLRMAMVWAAAAPPCLFSAMHADLEIAPLGRMTVLSLTGRYTCSARSSAHPADEARQHRAAAVVTRAFLERIGSLLVPAAAA